MILLFLFTVSGVMIGMDETTVSVDENDGSVDICADIVQLPGELQTDLMVALSTTNGSKAGLQLTYTSCSIRTVATNLVSPVSTGSLYSLTHSFLAILSPNNIFLSCAVGL